MNSEHQQGESMGSGAIYAKDYVSPFFLAQTITMEFNLSPSKTILTSTATYENSSSKPQDLTLDGTAKLVSLKINGKTHPYDTKKDGIILRAESLPGEPFAVEVVTELYPDKNTSLSGLYQSKKTICTQCEAEGFRNITFWQDRPDVMSRYTVKIIADKKLYPALLSNGDLQSQTDLENGLHEIVWHDPWPKPCYLFALVAGDFAVTEAEFITASERRVALKIYTEDHNKDKTAFAMKSLIAAMKWDEERFGLEYDLGLFNIVAVDDFNFGAMENKSLNIFNSKLILSSPEISTDLDYYRIEGVVGHEYFHNWTGNRVTCRDWFQLSLKEGLTVFRDQEFSADMNSETMQRILDSRSMRESQFPEDEGPLAHPVRPEKVLRFDNIYSKTVYQKGAEVVRMLQTLLGVDGFKKGLDIYFKRHDGQAVTCDDFVKAMEDANNEDLEQFRLWYSQAGTPIVHVETQYDKARSTYELRVKQSVPDTVDMQNKKPMLIPMRMGLIGQDGVEIPLDDKGVTEKVLRLTKEKEVFTFKNVKAPPIPSLFRGFSAPIKLEFKQNEDELFFILCNDPDEFNRYEAAQKLILNRLHVFVRESLPFALDKKFIESFRSFLNSEDLDHAVIAMAMSIPSESSLISLLGVFDPDAIHRSRRFLKMELAKSYRLELYKIIDKNHSTSPYAPDHLSKGKRAIVKMALSYLAAIGDQKEVEFIRAFFQSSKNMTDRFGALQALEILGDYNSIEQFYEEYRHQPLVLLKLFGLVASSPHPKTKERIEDLMRRPETDLKNPNSVYALIGGFCEESMINFHAKDGSGYRFLADMCMKVDGLNPYVSARIAQGFRHFNKLEDSRKVSMRKELERLAEFRDLSRNAFEIIDKILNE